MTFRTRELHINKLEVLAEVWEALEDWFDYDQIVDLISDADDYLIRLNVWYKDLEAYDKRSRIEREESQWRDNIYSNRRLGPNRRLPRRLQRGTTASDVVRNALNS